MSRSRKKNPYRGSRRFDLTCRCNGSCSYCTRNRLHQQVKALSSAQVQVKELV